MSGYSSWPYGPHIHPWAEILEPGYLEKRKANEERIIKKLEKYKETDRYLPVSFLKIILNFTLYNYVFDVVNKDDLLFGIVWSFAWQKYLIS